MSEKVDVSSILYPGKSTKYTPTMKSIYEYMSSNNSDYKDGKALTYFGRNFVFNEFLEMIERVAISFRMLGVEKGDYVPICSPNIPQGVISFYALNKIGAIPNMLPVLASEEEFSHYLKEVPAKKFVMFRDFYKKVIGVIPKTSIDKTIIISPSTYVPEDVKRMADMKMIASEIRNEFSTKASFRNRLISWDKFLGLSKGEKYVDTVTTGLNDTALLAHTGGSTGVPKSAIITNENFNSMVEQYRVITDSFERGDRILTVLPIFINYGLCNNIHMPLSFGIEVILVPTLDFNDAFNLFSKYKPNHFMCVGHYFEKMMEDPRFNGMDMSFLKNVIYGGAPVSPAVKERFDQFLKSHGALDVVLTNGYGMTEATSSIAYEQKTEYTKSYKLIQLPYMEFKIVEPDTTKEIVDETPGELCVNGPTVFEGYYGNKEETDFVLKKHDDGKIWLHTGDLVKKYEDHSILPVGRLKRLFPTMDTSNGNVAKIFPDNVENVIKELDFVLECAVEVKEHNERVNVPFLYVVLKEGYSKENCYDLIKEKCLELNNYSRPWTFFFLKELPKNSANKVNHKVLTNEIPDNYVDLISEEIYQDKVKNGFKKR